MQDQGGNLLRHIETLLKSGKSGEARPLLAEYLNRYPASARGWWLLSLLLTDEKQQIDCLERVLRLDPKSDLARGRLAKLRNTPAPASEPASLFSSVRSQPNFSTPFEEPELQQTAEVPIPAFSTAFEPEPAPEPVRPVSVPRPLPARKKPAAAQYGILAAVFCLVMGGIGALALMVFRQAAAPIQIPTPLELTQLPGSSSGWELPATWTPTITLTPPPSRTPLPSEALLVTPTLMFTLPATSIPSNKVGPSRGLYAPGFTLKNLSDDQVSLSDYAGKPVIVLFWATWCPYCEREMSALQSVYDKYQDAGLTVLAVDCGDSAAQVRQYRKSHGLSFPVLLDPKSKTLKLYQVNSFPSHFFIGADGRIVHIAIGMMSQAGLDQQVRIILSGRP